MTEKNIEKMKAFGKVFGYLILVAVSITAGAAVWPGIFAVTGWFLRDLTRSIYNVFLLTVKI